MTRLGLILRNLRYFRGVNLALAVGMIVATAVLTGALMVGDSMRGSLAQLAKDRLGPVDDALVSRRFFDESLAARLAADPQLAGRFEVVPAVILSGGVYSEDQTVRAGGVQILAAAGNWAPLASGQCILNGATAQALGMNAPGPVISLSVPLKPDEPRDAALSRRSSSDVLGSLRTTVARIDGNQDMIALFNPQGGQRLPRNVWVPLPELQDAAEVRGRVNVILVHDKSAGTTPQSADPLNARLREVVRLEDYGLKLEPAGDGQQLQLTSRMIYLDPPLVTAAQEVAGANQIPLQKVTVNLMTSVTNLADGNQSHYAIAAGISPLESGELAKDEVAINQWMADQLGAKVGDRLKLAYFSRSSEGNLIEQTSDVGEFGQGFKIARILPMTGVGADRTLTPQYQGLTDKDNIDAWEPPEGIRINHAWVTKADEDYWHKYRAAPKVFLRFDTAEKLWGGALGNVTSLRIPDSRAEEFRRLLHDRLDPAAMGLSFQPIMAQQLAAASGNTDFGEYFLYFSFFLIVAAVLLVAMLFRLNVEQRARQIGLLSAVGFKPWGLRRLALGEGIALAAIGALLGLPAAMGYTWLLMYGLRTWWNGAVGTTALHLYVRADTLACGFIASLFVAFFAILWAIWHVGRTSAATLLAGGWGTEPRSRRGGRIVRGSGIAVILFALVIFVYALINRANAAESFMSGGAILLMGCLLWLAGALRPGTRRPTGARGVATLFRLGIRSATRHTARSVVAIGLIAFAAFTLIVVAAFKQGRPSDTGDPASGAGGYRLIAQAGISLLGDLNTQTGRQILGFRQPDAPLWRDVHFVSMRRWQGQDVSCLNLTQPTTPTILAVPPILTQSLVEGVRHRFSFARVRGNEPNPWDLLSKPAADSIPVITDDNTAAYILHRDLGDTIDVRDAAGRTRHLMLVATLSNSIFQSELLMAESNFRELFPDQDGFGVVLADCPAGKQTEVQQALSTELGDWSVTVEPSSSRLMQFLMIQNTYLSTFQTLGALGLMLGTIGLAVVLVRTVIERRAELALLASLGFSRGARIRLVLSENLFLLLLGLATGAICALLGIVPAITQSSRQINYTALAATLLAVLAIGVICSTVAVWLSGAHVTPSDLRRE